MLREGMSHLHSHHLQMGLPILSDSYERLSRIMLLETKKAEKGSQCFSLYPEMCYSNKTSNDV